MRRTARRALRSQLNRSAALRDRGRDRADRRASRATAAAIAAGSRATSRPASGRSIDLAGAADVAGHHRRAAGERLDPDIGEALATRSAAPSRRRRRAAPAARRAAGCRGSGPARRGRAARSALRAPRRSGPVAGEDQGRAGKSRRAPRAPGPGPCAGSSAPTRDEQRPVDAERRLGRGAVDGPEAVEVDAGMVDPDLLGRHAERDHVALQRGADREQPAGRPAGRDDLRARSPGRVAPIWMSLPRALTEKGTPSAAASRIAAGPSGQKNSASITSNGKRARISRSTRQQRRAPSRRAVAACADPRPDPVARAVDGEALPASPRAAARARGA